MENSDNRQKHLEKIDMLKTQLESVQKAHREYKNEILKILLVGGIFFLFFGFAGSISGNGVFGGLAVITFVITYFVLQRVTNSNPNNRAENKFQKSNNFCWNLKKRKKTFLQMIIQKSK